MRHLKLIDTGSPRESFDPMAVTVAGGKIHPRVNPGGIGGERFLHHAHLLDESPPVDRTERAETADAVADQHLVGGLDMVVDPLQLLPRQSLVGKTMLDPAMHRRQFRPLPLQPGAELLDKLIAEGRIGLGHLSQDV